ncbi:MAG: hypothetical protein A2W52_00140 [Candidatus Taylorbacteria bacterium RIFCSPHIGHO2_02_49_25]|uniref:AB hydrolase-1 domain-containing protein n=1 Tax=Candidatus Taylorbacteria bacterium RIFCSPHIGHO2_02_49_25 TaxID=1802305 RepID=A0A1G2MGX7_9BACT|nr:MAG: Alpha/beta hydrolase fold protein [Parcubacteria group bacterium GW2011_GWF2_50_9]OGS18842.1 MAG: hypothetical protein A3J83_01770 [Elusimicrobia bacterium RIFOXYA2_FULL_40_6]OHA19725.1 MAG: hypothetical protein A2759_04040 [Candidatus Taylorbacteria bacterium RIFCSPHIGHO2_01_FULL_49_60]OHA23128.1 MAG: hypothetical protein A2W52_00140 [Candidatus Taylorbacteria bacterium RIFCSPHIGHO2_02_49_25]OHA35512.1 MAG: hypothetical protein A3B27_00345 [Candidatus Taylorbacteria bacterium RIFCSPLOW
MKAAIVNNLAVEYIDEGKGPILFLLHGWGDNLHTFDSLLAKLSASFRVVRLDLPGFGGSEAPEESWGVEEYAYFVKSFIEKLGIPSYIIIGHSFGGRIAIKGVGIGLLKPQKVVLISAAGLATNRKVRNQLLRLIAKIGKIALFPFSSDVKERLRLKLYRKVGGEDYIHAGALKETFLRVIGEDLSPAAQKINIPALLIWGEKDTATPLLNGKRLEELIPDSTLEVLEGAGHFVHQEKTDSVAALIQAFISQ